MMSECCCDYGYVEFYHKEFRKARTAHRCEECGCTIQQGEHYEHVRGKCEGEVYTANTCPRCLELRNFVQAHIPCFCWYHGTMREDAMEAALEWAHETAGLLFGTWRREVLIRRFRSAQKAQSAD